MRVARTRSEGAHAVGLVRRRSWLAVLCIVLLPAGVYVLAARQSNVHEAQVIVEGEPGPAFTEVGSVSIPRPTSARLARTHATTSSVIRDTTRRIGLPYSAVDGVSATVDERTGWVTLSVTASRPEVAVAVARALPFSLRRDLRQTLASGVAARIVELERGLATVRTPVQREELAGTLRDLRSIRSPEAIDLPIVETAERARVVAPQPRRDATLALVLAILLAPALMLAAERADRRIRRSAPLAALAGAPVLSIVPARSSRTGRPQEEAEAYARLRDGLKYLSAEGTLDVIAVMSALPGEGRTTVAAELALAFARTGRRVVVVDADLRGGDGVAKHLGVSPTPGLSDVLRGTNINDALQVVADAAGEVRVLPCGPPVADPGGLLGSARMSAAIEVLSARGALVVIDTAPVLKVSDALALLHQVSGVVCVVRLGGTPGDAVQRMSRLIRTAGGRILGVAATGGTAASASVAAIRPPSRRVTHSVAAGSHRQ